MSSTILNLGVTISGFTMAELVKHHPRNVIGAFWMPVEPEDYLNLGCKWIDYVCDDNPAQSMVDDLDRLNEEGRLYHHMIVLIIGNLSNPADYSYVAGISRFFESARLLRSLAEYNIPVHTEVSYPSCFDDKEGVKTKTASAFEKWYKLNLNDWDEYIRLRLISIHGSTMLMKWWERTSQNN